MHHQFKWLTNDGIEIFSQYWQPTENIKGVIIFIHGLGEHSGRYSQLAGKFSKEGYVFFTCDLRGSGKSGGKRGHTPAYECLMADIDYLLKEAKKRFPGQGQFLYGHSLGGNLVLNYSLRHNPSLKGVIATSPWLKLAFKPPMIKIILGEIIDLFWPSFSQENGISGQALSHDPQIIQDYQKDPLVHNRISVRLFYEAFRAGQWALANNKRFNLPLLLLHGTADKITSPQGSAQFAHGIAQCTFKLWEGQYHELHNEFIKEEFFGYILSWLNKQK